MCRMARFIPSFFIPFPLNCRIGKQLNRSDLSVQYCGCRVLSTLPQGLGLSKPQEEPIMPTIMRPAGRASFLHSSFLHSSFFISGLPRLHFSFFIRHVPCRCCIYSPEVVVLSLSELRTKDVISTHTGRNLGKVMDLEFDPCTGRVEALVVPGEFSLSCALRGEKSGVVIPWNAIERIGEHVILVSLPDDAAR